MHNNKTGIYKYAKMKRKKNEDKPGCGHYFLALFILFVGVSCMVFGFQHFSTAKNNHEWPNTEATVTKIELHESLGSLNDKSYSVSIHYQYQHAGELYTGIERKNDEFIVTDSEEDLAEAKLTMSQYHVRQKLNVIYSPESPEKSATEPGVRMIDVIILSMGVFFIGFAVLIWFPFYKL